jgi:peptide/nickel transport system permease protein
MIQLLARRLAASALILLGIAAITFVLLYLLPADPAVQLAGRSATAQTVANIRRELGLDQPLLVQFLNYLGNLMQGDLGRSYTQKTEVITLIMARLPATLLLMAAGIAV